MTTIFLALFGAIIIGETIRPTVVRLSRYVPRPASVAIVFSGLFSAACGLAYLPVRGLIREIGTLYGAVANDLAAGNLTTHVPQSLQMLEKPIAAMIAADPMRLGPALSTLSLALVMALFWLGASTPLAAFALTLLPTNRRADATSLFIEIGSKLGAYVGGTLVDAGITGIVSTVVLVAIGAPHVPPLGLLSGAAVAVPYLGTVVAAAACFAAVASTRGMLHGAEAAGAIVLVHVLEGTFVSPLVFAKRVDVDPLVCVAASAVGGTLFGITGLVLAVPAASVVTTLVVRVAAPALRRRSRITP